MHVLRDILQQAEKNGIAVGHFNVSDLVLLKAVFASAQELKVPVLVGASEGERKFVGTRQIAALVRSLREEFDYPIFLNADHTHSLEKGIEVAKAGFDAIVFDLSALPFEENVRQTKQAVEALKSINPAMLVEGEIGDIGTGSEIHDEAPDLAKGLTSPKEAGRNKEAPGYSQDRSNQERGQSIAHSTRRVGNRRRGFAEGDYRRDQYRPHQHRITGCMETWPGRRLGQGSSGSRPLQNLAVRSGRSEAGNSRAPGTSEQRPAIRVGCRNVCNSVKAFLVFREVPGLRSGAAWLGIATQPSCGGGEGIQPDLPLIPHG